MNTVQEQWSSFRTSVIPNDATPIQLQEMRRSFYAGVASMIYLQHTLSKYQEDTALIMLEAIYEECRTFGNDVRNNRD